MMVILSTNKTMRTPPDGKSMVIVQHSGMGTTPRGRARTTLRAHYRVIGIMYIGWMGVVMLDVGRYSSCDTGYCGGAMDIACWYDGGCCNAEAA